MFVDFGDSLTCKRSELKSIHHIGSVSMCLTYDPPRCFECALANVRPSQLESPNGFWPQAAVDLFIKLVENKKNILQASIHSLRDILHKISNQKYMYLLYYYYYFFVSIGLFCDPWNRACYRSSAKTSYKYKPIACRLTIWDRVRRKFHITGVYTQIILPPPILISNMWTFFFPK